MKAFADNTINVIEIFRFVLGRVENVVEKGENAGNRQCFQKALFLESFKVEIVWYRVKLLSTKSEFGCSYFESTIECSTLSNC